MKQRLIDSVTTSTNPDPNIQTSLNSRGGAITFFAYGVGVGTWTADINVTAAFDYCLDASPITLTISNITPTASMTIQSGANNFVGWVSSLTGDVSVNLIGEC